MVGIELGQVKGCLRKVSPRWKEPIYALRNISKKLAGKRELIADHLCDPEDFQFWRNFYQLPLEVFEHFTFDELCKIEYSSGYMHTTVEDLFKCDDRYNLVRKIQSSMWLYGGGRNVWNEVVDAYDHLTEFVFRGLPKDFSVRLDFTTGYNEYGYSKHSRTFLDGIFGFLVHYKGTHVMTIGFSIMNDRRILIQQVQMKNKKGNRFLYRLPKNRLEYIVDNFRDNFSGYDLYIVDGGDLSDRNAQSYKRRLECAKGNGFIHEIFETEKIIEYVKKDRERLVIFYSDVGRHVRDHNNILTINKFRYYKLILQ
ncbi:MAG: hypothetical protein WC819_03450 [Parcubacteria group bacterium]|jgi:hypothetical protein